MKPAESNAYYSRLFGAAAVACLLTALAACAPTAAQPRPTPGTPGSALADMHPSCRPDDFMVQIPDPVLARAIVGDDAMPAEGPAAIRCSALARVTMLRVSGVADLSGLQYAVNLNNLTMRQTAVRSLTPIEGLTRLATLNVQGGQLETLDSVSSLPALAALDVTDNFITDLSPLAGLPRLTFLNAKGNAIADISALAGLDQLTWVNLSDNQITDVSALAGSPSIQTLTLNNNLIFDAGPLATLPSLQRLELADNQLTDTDFIETLDLRSVNLSGNLITSVTGVARSSAIDGSRTVDLRNNCIDMASQDPFTRDVLSTGGRVLIEPQRDDC